SRTARGSGDEIEARYGSALGPPRDELVEVDRAVAVAVDGVEADAGLVVSAERVEPLQHRDGLVELDLAVAVRVVVVEAFLELRELVRIERHLRFLGGVGADCSRSRARTAHARERGAKAAPRSTACVRYGVYGRDADSRICRKTGTSSISGASSSNDAMYA